MGAKFWSPLFLSAASAAFTIFWGSLRGWDTTTLIAGILAAAFVLIAYVVARKGTASFPIGGPGGNAEALGDQSEAIGGPGGRGLSGQGGSGGDAVARGIGARARGGRGGDA